MVSEHDSTLGNVLAWGTQCVLEPPHCDSSCLLSHLWEFVHFLENQFVTKGNL